MDKIRMNIKGMKMPKISLGSKMKLPKKKMGFGKKMNYGKAELLKKQSKKHGGAFDSNLSFKESIKGG